MIKRLFFLFALIPACLSAIAQDMSNTNLGVIRIDKKQAELFNGLAVAKEDGDLAFDMVKQMAAAKLSPR